MELKRVAQRQYELAVEQRDTLSMRKYASRTSKLSKEMVEEAKELVHALGLPVIQAPSEAEAQAAHMVKKGELAVDYGVLPLEGLWWAEDMSKFSVESKGDWKWTLMIMQPEYITRELVAEATEQLRNKKNPVALSSVGFKSFTEGKAAQLMHIGPFSEEAPTIEKVHQFIEEKGSQRKGKHHEIYLSDIRKAAPEKWKTIIRQPMI